MNAGNALDTFFRHIVDAIVYADQLIDGAQFQDVDGGIITVRVLEDGTITLLQGGMTARVVKTDILSRSAVFHVD